jgi:hypothetical protein
MDWVRLAAGSLFTAQLFAMPARLSAQSAPTTALLDSKPVPGAAVLKICLRLEDESPFLGPATVRVSPEEGNELLGMPADGPGEFLFSGVTSGKYVAVVGAPGYSVLTVSFKIADGPRQKSLYIPMKPKLGSALQDAPEPLVLATSPGSAPSEPPPSVPSVSPEKSFTAASEPQPRSAPSPASSSGRDFWNPGELEAHIPPTEPGVSCPTEEILRGVGQRMAEFVQTLERFTATEKLEHFSVDRNGVRKSPETRAFSYVVSVSRNSLGTFLLDEYRDGHANSEDFPAHTASRGSPAMALLFHPALASDFEFRCEGLGQWAGRSAWQIHFAQRRDHPIRIRSYSVGGRSVGLSLEGRVWIDPGNDQVLRLESELSEPLPQIALTHEHFAIDYEPVQFHSTGQRLWLPQTAELYVERKGKRFYRRHVYSDFRLFNVDASQKIQAPAQSFSFTNISDRDVSGELTIETPGDFTRLAPAAIRFSVPAHSQIFKLVGPGKDIDLPPSAVESATFVHDGDPDAIKVDTRLARGTSLDIVSRQPRMAQSSQPPVSPPAQP